MITSLFYYNRKGKRVDVQVTSHALRRFSERYERIAKPCDDTPEEALRALFQASVPLQLCAKANYKYHRRNRRHGKHTLYFRSGDITFVVRDQTIITVEISAKGMRHLN